MMNKIKDKKAQRDIDVKSLGPLVDKLAMMLIRRVPSHSLLTRDDLYQVGIVAVLECIDRYDESRGASLQTYLSFRIIGAMKDEMRKMDPLPKTRRKRIREGLEEAPTWISMSDLGDEADIENRSNALDEYTFRMYPDPVFDEVLLLQLKELAQSRMQYNTRRIDDRGVAALRIERGMTLREIGLVLGVSESRVCQIFADVTKDIRPLVNG